MSVLSRETILSRAPELPRELVPVPEWGGDVWVRTISASERDQLEMQWEKTKRVHFRARLVWYCACDEKGADLFQETDIPVLGAHSTAAITRICDVGFRLNGFTKTEIEELEKNLPSGPPSDSSTA
jgi:hypothetical protein